MAKLLTKKNKDGSKRYAICFTLNGKDKSISFGRKFAGKIKDYQRIITEVVTTIEAYGPDYPLRKSTRAFIDEDSELKTKLQKAGLILAPKQSTLAGLWDMLDEHAETMGFKETTLSGNRTARKWFFRYFEGERRIETVTEKDTEEFQAWLKRQNSKYDKPLAPVSVVGIIKVVKTAFNLACRARIIADNPFGWIRKESMSNPARHFEVSASIMPDVLNACPTQGWRVLFALWRFGGLRKMEPFLLTWDDILWDVGKIRVHSPKTERYEGHAERFCPLFPEIRQELEDLWELAESGAVYVFPDDVRKLSANALYNAVGRIVKRAGFTPWERLINNMRATRDSELKRAGFSSDQRAAWLGHDEKVSREHYQMSGMLVNGSDYNRACKYQTLPTDQPVDRTTGKTVSKTVSQTR